MEKVEDIECRIEVVLFALSMQEKEKGRLRRKGEGGNTFQTKPAHRGEGGGGEASGSYNSVLRWRSPRGKGRGQGLRLSLL